LRGYEGYDGHDGHDGHDRARLRFAAASAMRVPRAVRLRSLRAARSTQHAARLGQRARVDREASSLQRSRKPRERLIRTYPFLNSSMTQVLRLDRLRAFVGRIASLVDEAAHDDANDQANNEANNEAKSEARLLEAGAAALRELIAHDDWLPDAFAQPHPERYQQFLLHADSQQRFSIVSFVWGPGQATPVHDHTVWGLIGVLRGAEIAQAYRIRPDGALTEHGAPQRLERGAVDAVSPRIGDIHRVSNAFGDRTSISIHVYGANIGAVSRSVYADDAVRKTFISGYSNDVLPNIWNVSKEFPVP
jgi:predicted metal-dependent enzyme (double-stranded beta helix superfamily)